MQIAVVDLGLGNLRSVQQALRAVAPDADVQVTSDKSLIESADKVVLPGQGAIGTWFSALRERDLGTVLAQSLSEKPLLGICVGMQALFDFCEEGGGVNGLGLFAGRVSHFKNFHSNFQGNSQGDSPANAEDGAQADSQPNSETKVVLKIPQMGWNQVRQINAHPLWQDIDNDAYFYFVHSYCANMGDLQSPAILGTTDYGHEFISAVGAKNVFAVQFHPEKSHQDGLRLLKNFTEWDGRL